MTSRIRNILAAYLDQLPPSVQEDVSRELEKLEQKMVTMTVTHQALVNTLEKQQAAHEEQVARLANQLNQSPTQGSTDLVCAELSKVKAAAESNLKDLQARYQQNCQQLQDEIARLTGQLSSALASNSVLQTQLDSKEKCCKECQGREIANCHEKAQLAEGLGNCAKRVQELETHCAKRVQELETQGAQIIKNLTDEKEWFQHHANRLISENEQLARAKNEALAELAAMGKTIAALTEQASVREAELKATFAAKVSELEASLADADTKIAELETEKNEAATKITELEKAIATSTEQASVREAELKARIAELEAANCIIV
jgi:chromosome segregation ATPase